MAQSAFGMLLQAKQFQALLDTLRMFSQWLFLLMIDRSLPVVLTTKSRFGTLDLSASTLLTRTNIPMLFHALSFTMLLNQLSALQPLGTKLSKFGTTFT